VLPQPLIQQPRGATHSGIDPKGVEGAIPHAGAALHTGIKVRNPRPAVFEFEHLVRTDLQAPAATSAFFPDHPESSNVSQIAEIFHGVFFASYRSHPASSSKPPATMAVPMAGNA